MLEKLFKLKANNTSVKTEVLAGITTFMTMAYILSVNPAILGAANMDKGAVFTATALSAVIATLVMSLVARLPFALAPGMGLNAFFAYTVVLTMGYKWEFALTAVFIEGIIFLLLTVFNIRELIVKVLPKNIRYAISVGIGLFIALIGLKKAGLVVDHNATLLTLGDVSEPTTILAIVGIVLTAVLLILKVRGAFLIGIILTAIIGIPMGITHLPEGHSYIEMPPSLSPIFLKFDFSNVFSMDMLVLVLIFLFVDMFDSVGTLVGVATKTDMIDNDGNIPRVKQAFFADSIGTTCGAILGTSTVTTYVESASGVAEGGRTGLTSFTVAVLFLLSLIFAPIFLMIPSAALSPVLIIVGLFMMSPIQKIDLNDFKEAIPAFITIIFMPFTYSIADGIIFGFLTYVILRILVGRFDQVSVPMYILALLFFIKLWGSQIIAIFQ